jgi:hypothetical protein
MDLIFVFRIPLAIVAVVLLIIFFPAGVIVCVALAAYLLWRWVGRRERIQLERRDAAISLAVSELPRAERYAWQNREGRYAAPGAIPRNLATSFMTESEKRRRDNRAGEFSSELD